MYAKSQKHADLDLHRGSPILIQLLDGSVFPFPVNNSYEIGVLDSGQAVGYRYYTPALKIV